MEHKEITNAKYGIIQEYSWNAVHVNIDSKSVMAELDLFKLSLMMNAPSIQRQINALFMTMCFFSKKTVTCVWPSLFDTTFDGRSGRGGHGFTSHCRYC